VHGLHLAHPNELQPVERECIQAAGGGLASAAGNKNISLLNTWNEMMIVGVVLQVFIMSSCGLLAADFAFRCCK